MATEDPSRFTFESFVAAVEERLTQLQEKIDEEIMRARRDLSTLVDTSKLATMLRPRSDEEIQLMAVSKLQDGGAPKAYIERLEASDVRSNREIARRVQVHPSLVSMWVRGERPIPMRHALAIQEMTRSEKFSEGIEPTRRFWRGGVRE